MISYPLRCFHPDPDQGQDPGTSAPDPGVSEGEQGLGPGLGPGPGQGEIVIVLTLREGTVPAQDLVLMSRVSTGINHLLQQTIRVMPHQTHLGMSVKRMSLLPSLEKRRWKGGHS